MQNQEKLGAVFHEFRKNRNISLKQIADEHVSSSLISRFERGEADISITKFLHALENMRVEVGEFMEAVRGQQRSETIEFMIQLVPLEYKRDTQGFQRLFDEQREKYVQNPSVYQYHLNMILAYGFICKCDTSIPFPQDYMDEVMDYLFSVDEWNIYEMILIGNLYLFMSIDQLHRMGQEIADKCYTKKGNKEVIRITLLNIFETCIHKNELDIAEYYKNIILPMLERETLLYERTIFRFLVGLYRYKRGEQQVGMEQMEQAIQIFDWLECDNLAENYRHDLTKHTT